MNSLQNRQLKIQEKRKQTPRRDFLMDVASWVSIVLTKHGNSVTRYAEQRRWRHKTSWWYEDFVWELDENKIFFDAFTDLWQWVCKPMNIQFGFVNENTQWADQCFGAKNAYLTNNVWGWSENVYYSTDVYPSGSNVFNSAMVGQSENIYMSSNISKSFNIFYAKNITDCSDIFLSANLIGCSFCINCNELTNASYCVDNKQVSKEEFEHAKVALLRKWDDFLTEQYAALKATNINSKNCTWKGLLHCEDLVNWLRCKRITSWRNCVIWDAGDKAQNCYDVVNFGIQVQDYYGVALGGIDSEHVYCSSQLSSSSHIYYSYHLENCSFCLGCIWLKNKSYCILNKQYTKEERYEKVDEIFSQMEQDGTLGEFFPATMNPFYFNDTAAYLIDPSFTKEEVTAKWYLRRDEPIKVDIPEDAVVVKSSDLDQFEWFDPEWNWTINAEVLKQVIQDEQWNFYRIIPMEYKFLVKHWLPLPRKHWLERIKENFRIN